MGDNQRFKFKFKGNKQEEKVASARQVKNYNHR